MEEKLFYPAVFHKEENGYWVSFPDVPEALTEGNNMQEAYKMTVYCLKLALTVKIDENIPLPTPSFFKNIKLQDNESLIAVEFDLLDYKKQTKSRAQNTKIEV